MEKQRYITIQEWMLELKLKGSELIAFALVWGFTQDGRSIYHGGSAYAAKWLGVSKENARLTLNRLAERGLLEKIEINENGVKFCNYRVPQNLLAPTPKTRVSPTIKIGAYPTIKIGDNNKTIEIKEKKGVSLSELMQQYGQR